MKHDYIHKELIYYLDNELSNEKRTMIENHLKGCSDCRSFLAFLKDEMQIITEEKNPEASPFFYTRLSARLNEKREHQPQSLWLRFGQPAFYSLILAISVYSGLQLGSNASISISNQAVSNNIQMFNDFEAEPIESFLLNEL